MAQGYYEGYQAPQSGYSNPYAQPAPVAGATRAGMGRILNLSGAVLSVVLVVGVAVWSYQLMVRDVTGVPVIRALGGPMRVSHDDPGGRQQEYQGLAVNSVAAQGSAEAPQLVVLAPAPIDLAPEDAPGIARTAVEAPVPVQSMIPPPAPLGSAPQETAALDSAPLATEALTLLPASVPGIARSPMPRQRPGTLVASAGNPAPLPAGSTDAEAEALLQELVTRLGTPRAIDVDPTTLPPGTRLVQLGIYEDADTARQAWETMASRNPAWLEGRGRVIEPATSGGRVFYRLRALGFADEPEARRFCSLFRAENLDCIPTLVR